MRITAKADNAVRALLELTVAEEGPRKGERISQAQDIPLGSWRTSSSTYATRESSGPSAGPTAGTGWPGPPTTIGEVIRAVEGPLATVRGESPENVDYRGAAKPLRTVWVALRASLRSVVDELTLADVAADRMPARIRRLTEQPDAWSRR